MAAFFRHMSCRPSPKRAVESSGHSLVVLSNRNENILRNKPLHIALDRLETFPSLYGDGYRLCQCSPRPLTTEHVPFWAYRNVPTHAHVTTQSEQQGSGKSLCRLSATSLDSRRAPSLIFHYSPHLVPFSRPSDLSIARNHCRRNTRVSRNNGNVLLILSVW